jgi:hypothetical protein
MLRLFRNLKVHNLSSSPGRVKDFVFSTTSRQALEPTHPPIERVQGVKRQGREADHSPPISDKVKLKWTYTSTNPTRLHDIALS